MSNNRKKPHPSALALGLTILLSLANGPVWAGEQTWSGTLGPSSPTWTRPVSLTVLSGVGVDVRYETREFYVSTADTCTMETIGGSGDPYSHLYKDAFSATNQFTNLLALDDDGGGGFRPKITFGLMPGTTYLLVTTEFSPDFADMAYTNKISCPVATVTFAPTTTTTCASEGYTGAKLTWCQNICENGLTGQTLDTWIHRWVNRYRQLPYCAVGGLPD